jgi:P pilus assembly chaperone PapD
MPYITCRASVTTYRWVWAALLAAAATLLSSKALAGAVLFIHPTLVVFDGDTRSARITLTNRGDETGTFECGWMELTMNPEGALRRLESQPGWSVAPHLRYSPRRVTLEPSQSQVIKIALRPDADMPQGEYYSHFRILTLNSEAPRETEVDSGDEAPASSGVSIQARTAVAIPVVWRNGDAVMSARIESLSLNREGNRLTVDVEREGPLSSRGFLHVLLAPPGKEAEPIGEPAPLVIYPNLEGRSVTLDLPDLPEGGPTSQLTVIYSTEGSSERRGRVLATRSVSI